MTAPTEAGAGVAKHAPTAMVDHRACGGSGCSRCGYTGTAEVACVTPPASFSVRRDPHGFEQDRQSCPCYEGVKINDDVDQCTHPANRGADNWCALETCPLLTGAQP